MTRSPGWEPSLFVLKLLEDKAGVKAEEPDPGWVLALSHSPRRMSCRCLKFSIQPELPLNFSGGMPNDPAISSARRRMSWSVMLTSRSVHSWRDLTISNSTSGNLDGLEKN